MDVINKKVWSDLSKIIKSDEGVCSVTWWKNISLWTLLVIFCEYFYDYIYECANRRSRYGFHNDKLTPINKFLKHSNFLNTYIFCDIYTIQSIAMTL